jgi:hypothetical protein
MPHNLRHGDPSREKCAHSVAAPLRIRLFDFHAGPAVKPYEMIGLQISLDWNIYNRLVTENSFRIMPIISYFDFCHHAPIPPATAFE